ncbi:hypothetical protein FNV43_RR22278 [Rhamnella rubrinervis]|uniref:GCVT N-terminal domain-containing protein n=2 Tax=Magnoliopsida TaxID=3398 RepID=A0A8K0GRX5_9ROSA|nr:hypothetical protein FNV43_RR22278 [Rhamnella rubrinervis]
MDPEQTFIRVQERFSQMLTPKMRAALEYICLFVAITLFCILVVMHANYVQQPGCSSELSGVETSEAQLIQIKITSAGLWSQNESESDATDGLDAEPLMDKLEVANVDGDGLIFSAAKFWLNWIGSSARRGKLALKFWKTDTEHERQSDGSPNSQSSKATTDDAVIKVDREEPRSSFPLSVKDTFKAAFLHFGKKWYKRMSFIWRHALQIVEGFSKLWNFAGIHLNLDIPKWLRVLHLDKVNFYAVQFLEKRSKTFEPSYLYTMEKGYLLLPEVAKSRHNIVTVNISIPARHSCFGNRWQQLLINRFVGYDTILMNSLLSSPGRGYLYNYQTKEFYNLSYAQELPEGPARFGDYLVTKCGVLMMSLFVFFTTTMSVSFTLRETQSRMLKFTVQLQHHARHRLPTFQLIFVHVIESLVFVPIMIGILFFLFEFYDDQLLAFVVLILVWLSELFTLISVRTPISMKFFPRFFLLYFLVFHIYFFSYSYGFSYLALSTTASFMTHLILYFWNRFEVPALQRFMQNRRSQLQQHPDFQITSSTILASTLHITRLNTRNPGLVNSDLTSGAGLRPVVGNSMQMPGQADLRQADNGPNPGTMNSFSSLLLWILGGASSEGLNSFLSMFRDVRDQGQVYADPTRSENRTNQNTPDVNGRCFFFLTGCSASKSMASVLSSHQNGAFSFSHNNIATWPRKLSLSPKTTTSYRTLAALPFDLSPPPIDHDLVDTVATAGAKVSDGGIVETFGDDDEALEAVDNGIAVVDLSHFGRIRVSGDDRIQFLHNQSTANFECLHEGQGCDTVFVTPTARTIDIAHAWIMKNAVNLVVSPLTCQTITEMLKKYIFFGDKVEIQDITKKTCFFVLVGPKSNQLMEDLNLGDLVGQPYGTHHHFSVNGMPVTIGVGNVISDEGFSLMMSPASAGSIWKTLLSQGAIPMGSNAWEKLRVIQGRPAPKKELTNEYNVLEAGLWNSISLNKGCYKGQETISRLITYNGVKQTLWGISLSAAAEPGSPIIVNGKKVGKLTSYAPGKMGIEHVGLCYIKRQGAYKGDTVNVGDNITGTIIEVPYLARQHPPSKSSNS